MDSYDAYADEELIRKLRQGENSIYDYLLEKYKNLVRKRAREMFLVGGDTDDLIQEGMIGLFKAIRDYRPDRDTAFSTFARLCIDRQLYHAVESSMRQKHQPLNSYLSMSEEESQILRQPESSNPEQIVIAEESLERLKDEIFSSLSEMESLVLTEYLEGNSYEEIAVHIGKTPKSVDNALRRIRTKIKEKIKS